MLTASAAPGCQPNWPLDAAVNICHVAQIDMVADELDFYFQLQAEIVVTALDTSDPCPPECNGLAIDCRHPDRTGENGFTNRAWGTFRSGGPLTQPAIEALGCPCSGGTSPSLLNFSSGNPNLPWTTGGIKITP